MPAYSVLQSRAAPVAGGGNADGSGCLASCCPAMDLVALASGSQLVVNRSIKWEPVFRSASNVSCLAWRPDGKALAVGQEDGVIVLYDVENGEEFTLPRSSRPHASLVVSMCWVKEEAEDLGATPRDRAATTLLPVVHLKYERGHPNRLKSSAAALIDMPLFGVENSPRRQLEVLVSGDTAGVVTMGAFGYFPIGCIDLCGAFGGSGGKPTVRHVCLSDDLRMLLTVLRQGDTCRLVSVDTSVLADNAEELRHVAAQGGHVSEQIDHVHKALDLMGQKWATNTAKLDKHIEPLRHQLQCFERPNTPEQELFMMLTCGVTSAALQRYIDDLQESALERMGRELDETCVTVEELGTKTLRHAAQALVFRLHDMLGLAQSSDRYKAIGLDPETIQKVLDAAQQLLLKAEELLVWVREARANLAAFTVWLLSVVRKYQKQNAPDAAPHRKPLGHVDTDRLVTLLSHQLLHNHITEQFKKEPLKSREAPANWTTATQGIDATVSLRQAFERLLVLWRKAFHMTAERVSEDFKPLENSELDYVSPRLLDVCYTGGTFRVAMSADSGKLTVMSIPCARSGAENAEPAATESPGPVCELSLDGVREVSDVRFYGANKLLLTCRNNDGKRCIGELGISENDFLVGGKGATVAALDKFRELAPQSWETSNMVCQGKRGIAIVFTSNRRLSVLDIEDDEESDSEGADSDSGGA